MGDHNTLWETRVGDGQSPIHCLAMEFFPNNILYHSCRISSSAPLSHAAEPSAHDHKRNFRGDAGLPDGRTLALELSTRLSLRTSVGTCQVWYFASPRRG